MDGVDRYLGPLYTVVSAFVNVFKSSKQKVKKKKQQQPGTNVCNLSENIYQEEIEIGRWVEGMEK